MTKKELSELGCVKDLLGYAKDYTNPYVDITYEIVEASGQTPEGALIKFVRKTDGRKFRIIATREWLEKPEVGCTCNHGERDHQMNGECMLPGCECLGYMTIWNKFCDLVAAGVFGSLSMEKKRPTIWVR